MEQSNSAKDPQETIFDESELLDSGYDKHVRRARITIFVLAGITLLLGLLLAFTDPTTEEWLVVAMAIVIAGTYTALGIWANARPYQAITIALVLFVSLILLTLILDPAGIFSGIILKIIVVVYLVRGINSSRETLRRKQALGKA
jgi:hypothetical protein